MYRDNLCYGEALLPIKGTRPVPEIHSKRNANVSALRTRLSKARKYLTKSTLPHLQAEWENRIGKYEVLLVAAEARARRTA